MNATQRPMWSLIALAMAVIMSGCGHGKTAQLSSLSFESLDTNHDNVIEATESDRNPKLAGVFSRADVDHDGRLDKQEFNRALEQLAQPETQTGNG